MGNIEIRQNSSRLRRTSIFSQKKSFTPTKTQFRSALKKFNLNLSERSPVRFSNKNYNNTTGFKLDNSFTSRKNNYTVHNQQGFSQKYPITDVNRNKGGYSTKKRDDQSERRTQSVINSFNNTNSFNESKKLKQLNVQNNQNSLGRIVPNSVRSQRNDQNLFDRPHIQSQHIRNPLQNREIIKKVRNFNDFLNEIKRKLKQDKLQAFQRKNSSYKGFKQYSLQKENISIDQQTDRFISFNDKNADIYEAQTERLKPNKSTRKIQVALKLENEKLQLQKYRKLVERQLSKNHSIENISLCTKNSGQKILTIQYESFIPENQNRQTSIQQSQSAYNRNNLKIQKLNLSKFSKTENNKQNTYQSKQKMNTDNNFLKKLKEQYEITMRNMIMLGKTIQKFETSQKIKHQRQIMIERQQFLDQTFSKISETKNKQQKIDKIESLFEKLSDIQSQYQNTDRMIKQAMSESNSVTQNDQQDNQ